MPNWTKDELRLHQIKEASRSRVKRADTKLECDSGNDSLGQDKAEKENSKVCCVRIVSFRTRILDPDNLAGGCKYHIDALRYSGLIEDDDPDSIKLMISQQKVHHRDEERTVIMVSWEPKPW